MATARPKTEAEPKGEKTVIEEPKISMYDKVDYMLELDWSNPKANEIQFVSVPDGRGGDYTAYIKRGEVVKIPRFVARFLNQQQRDERAARLRHLAMADEWRRKLSEA